MLGGQKARVALARTCYCRPAVALLDDPLSAVDPRVARTLFSEAVLGLLAGSTRILVTHQRQFLPQCDRVLVLRGGRVAALGSWEEVAGSGMPELGAPAEGAAMPVEVSVDEAAEAIQAAERDTGKPGTADEYHPSKLALPTASPGDASAEDAGNKASGRSDRGNGRMPEGERREEGDSGSGGDRQVMNVQPSASVVLQLLPADGMPNGPSPPLPDERGGSDPTEPAPVGGDRGAAPVGAPSSSQAPSAGLSRERTFKFLTGRRQAPVKAPAAGDEPYPVFEEGGGGTEEGGFWKRLTRSLSSKLLQPRGGDDEAEAASRTKSRRQQEVAGGRRRRGVWGTGSPRTSHLL